MLSECSLAVSEANIKGEKSVKKIFSYSLCIHRVVHNNSLVIHLISHGHPQFKKNNHGFDI